MLSSTSMHKQTWDLMGYAGASSSVFIAAQEIALWIYRPRTMGLLRRYARASFEAGALPSPLGRELFGTSLTPYSVHTFEDIAIFVADMDRSLDRLSEIDRTLITMSVIEGYTIAEVAQLMHYSERTIERQLFAAVDELTCILLRHGMLKILAYSPLAGDQ